MVNTLISGFIVRSMVICVFVCGVFFYGNNVNVKHFLFHINWKWGTYCNFPIYWNLYKCEMEYFLGNSSVFFVCYLDNRVLSNWESHSISWHLSTATQYYSERRCLCVTTIQRLRSSYRYLIAVLHSRAVPSSGNASWLTWPLITKPNSVACSEKNQSQSLSLHVKFLSNYRYFSRARGLRWLHTSTSDVLNFCFPFFIWSQ